MKKYLYGERNLRTLKFLLEAGLDLLYYERGGQAGDVIVTWGVDAPFHIPAGVQVLNPHLVLNKNRQIHMLRAAGVPAPRSWDSTSEWKELGSPQPILRKKIYSASGWGIKLLSGPEEMWENGDPERMIRRFDIGGGRIRQCYFQEFIDKDVEYRLTMVGPHVAYIMTKSRVIGEIVWNVRAGSCWTPANLTPAFQEKLRALGEAAMKAIGYHLGGIDVIAKGNDLYVLEVNSRPQLSRGNATTVARTISRYCDELRRGE